MKTLKWVPLFLILAACSKHPEDKRPAATPTPASPPINNCQGATIPWSLPLNMGAQETIPDNSHRDFTIPNFDSGCGDTLNVYLRKDSGQAWFQLPDHSTGASFYLLNGNNVTVYNATGIVQEVTIEAVLY